MIIQLDSNFRDYARYPYSTDYVVTVNGTPPDDLHANDVRSSYLSSEYIRYAYRWIGKSEIDSNPLSQIPNDSLALQFIPRSSRTALIIPSSIDEFKIQNDYFVGLIFWNETNKLSANVIQYSFSTLTLTFDSDIFEEYICNVQLDEIHNIDPANIQNGYLINPSTHAGKNLLLLGTTRFSSAIDSKLVLVKGLNSELYITNVTKNWTTEIISIEGQFRNVIVKSIPSYESNDFFIVTLKPATNQLQSRMGPFLDGIQNFQYMSSSGPLVPRETFVEKNKGVILEVLHMNEKTPEFILVHPGNLVSVGTLTLTSLSHTKTLTIQVTLVGSGIIFEPNIILQTTRQLERKTLLSIVNPIENDILYFVILEKKDNILYLDINALVYGNLERIFLREKIFYGYLIPYYTVFPNVVVPFTTYQNTVCCLVRLVSLSLPNLPVCGFNIRLADFPYVLIAFSNAQGTVSEIQSQISSNVPSVTNCNFVCPISNIKNPDLNFVSITTKQYAIFKFKPRDSLRFQVLLPNGEVLKYSRSGVNFLLLENLETNFSERQEFCVPLNVPLNPVTSATTKMVYPYNLNNNLNAVFDFQYI